MLLAQSEVAQHRLQTLSDDPAVSDVDLVHTGKAVGSDPVPNAIDQKYAYTRERQETFPRRLSHELRGNHPRAP